jgi:hypothetical protein
MGLEPAKHSATNVENKRRENTHAIRKEEREIGNGGRRVQWNEWFD